MQEGRDLSGQLAGYLQDNYLHCPQIDITQTLHLEAGSVKTT